LHVVAFDDGLQHREAGGVVMLWVDLRACDDPRMSQFVGGSITLRDLLCGAHDSFLRRFQ